MAYELSEACKEFFTSGVGSCPVDDFFVAGAISFVIALSLILAFLILIAVYLYFAYSWVTISRKLKHKNPNLAWIPFVNLAMMLQFGGFHWAWIFLALIPILGWIALLVLLVISTWRIFDRRGYPGWFSLSLVIPKIGLVLYLVAIGFVAFKDKRGKARVATSKPKRKKRKK